MQRTIGGAATANDWTGFLRANPQVAALDAFVIDVNGNTLGKRLPIAEGARVFTDGVQFSASALIADSRGLGHNVQGLGSSDGDPDGTALPVPGALCLAPWTRTPTAQVLCEMRHVESREPYWYDPREILAGVVRRCRDAGLYPVVACELEFYLIDPRRGADGGLRLAGTAQADPPRRAANLSLEAVEVNAAFIDRVEAAAATQGVPVCGAVAEYGIGQFEVNLRHVADPLLAADHAVLLKRIVRGVARSMDIQATFMAKPFIDQPGSGLHVHVSLADANGGNRFAGPGGEASLQHAIAGMQAMMYDSFGLCAPNLNSYRRHLGPFVPRSRDWGYNNRSVAFRVPAARGEGRRVEHRVAGADASPHLVVAAILAAILHGIQHELPATLPAQGRVESAPDGEFPDGLLAALDRMRNSPLLAQYLAPRFLDAFRELKRREHAALMHDIVPREYDFYL
ncbi:MAG TPA: glutamine synthetase family protein [Steroidobacteraceae bacterium]|nr:glutamine synthetase family protein [Steroidobacteraceae bacterium]